jgi:hypothetical protein
MPDIPAQKILDLIMMLREVQVPVSSGELAERLQMIVDEEIEAFEAHLIRQHKEREDGRACMQDAATEKECRV